METTNKPEADISQTTLGSLKSVAFLSSALSVVYTVLLASKAVKGPEGEPTDLFAVGLSVSLAVCFEGAKYAFMYAGFDLGKSSASAKSKVLRLIGSALFTISICISILSIAATKQYIEDTSALTEKTIKTSEEQEKSKKITKLVNESLALREIQNTLQDVSDKIASGKARSEALLEEKQALIDAGMLSKASTVERTLSSISAQIDANIEKREELVLASEDEMQKIKESVQGEISMAKTYGNSTVVLAVVLEIVSLLSVAVYSFLGKQGQASAAGVEVSVQHSNTNPVAKKQEPTTAPARKQRDPKKVPVSAAKAVAEPFEHDWVLEVLAGEKVTVESVRKAARCSQSTAMAITKEIKAKQIQEQN